MRLIVSNCYENRRIFGERGRKRAAEEAGAGAGVGGGGVEKEG